MSQSQKRIYKKGGIWTPLPFDIILIPRCVSSATSAHVLLIKNYRFFAHNDSMQLYF